MDRSSSSVWIVGLGTLTISATSAVVTGVYSILRGQTQASLLAGSAALNSGITAATFFSCREYAITPLLTYTAPWQQYAHRRRDLDIDPLPDDTPGVSEAVSWSDLRVNKLLDSGLSGAITGGVLRGLTSGRRTALPTAITAGAVCTLLQYGFNELTVARLRYISRLKEEKRPAVERPAFVPRGGEKPSEPSMPITQSLLKMVGLIPVSDEEYLAKMKRSREIYLKRIAKLERQIEEEKALKDLRKS